MAKKYVTKKAAAKKKHKVRIYLTLPKHKRDQYARELVQDQSEEVNPMYTNPENNAHRKNKTKEEKRPRPRMHEDRVLRAIEGTGGIYRTICKRLNCGYGALKTAIAKFPSCAQAVQDEREAVGDLAEITVLDLMRQRFDIGEAGKNARWYLERKHSDRGFSERKITQIEGGEKALQVQAENSISIEALDLPIEVRKAILKAYEEKEAHAKAVAEANTTKAEEKEDQA